MAFVGTTSTKRLLAKEKTVVCVPCYRKAAYVANACGFFLVLLLIVGMGILWSDRSIVVNTEQGALQGFRQQVRGRDVYRFLGVPYGQDTSGKGRFAPPLPAEKRSHKFVADEYGPPCPQGALYPGDPRLRMVITQQDYLSVISISFFSYKAKLLSLCFAELSSLKLRITASPSARH